MCCDAFPNNLLTLKYFHRFSEIYYCPLLSFSGNLLLLKRSYTCQRTSHVERVYTGSMSGLVVVGKWSPSLVRVRAKWTERSVGKCNSIELKMSFTRKEIFYEWKLWVSKHIYFLGWKLWIFKGYYSLFSKNILDLVLNWLLNWLVKKHPVHFQRTL